MTKVVLSLFVFNISNVKEQIQRIVFISFFLKSNENRSKIAVIYCAGSSVLTLHYKFHCCSVCTLCCKNQNKTNKTKNLWMKIARETNEGRSLYMSAEYQGCRSVCLHSVYLHCISLYFFQLRFIVHRYALMLLFVLCQTPIILTLQWKHLCSPFLFGLHFF